MIDTKMHYDPNKDHSEEFDWKKYSNEHIPTEEDQDYWSKVIILFSIISGLTAILIL